jgi:hypothetical protein
MTSLYRSADGAEAVTHAAGKDKESYLAVVEDISLTGSKTSGTPIVLRAARRLCV